MKKSVLIIISLIILSLLTISGCKKDVSLEERRLGVLSELNMAIEEAEKSGVYKCCIEPACTMCYLSGNKWNYGKGGTCACDEFIAKGEDPCPQCVKGIEEGNCESTEEFCDVESDIFRSAT